MHYFNYKYRKLYVEDIPVETIANNIETPFYLYSYKTIIHHINRLKDALSDLDNLICFSVKSNDHLSILKIIQQQGIGFDVVSVGEIYKVLKVSQNLKNSVFAGAGKQEYEIKLAIENNIFLINVESFEEALLIDKIAKEKGVIQEIVLRVNPFVEVETHKYDITGSEGTKFGVSFEDVFKISYKIKKLKNLKLAGLHFHIGSQILKIEPYKEALQKITNIFLELRKDRYDMKYLDIGGGMGVIYNNEKPLTAYQFFSKIKKYLKKIQPAKIICEPGRFIMGNSAILVSKVLYLKKSGEKNFLIIDAAMNDLIRPALYNAYHKIVPVSIKNRKKMKCDIVGPVCESGDFLGLNRKIQKMKEEECLAIMTAGAYASTMSSNYNSRLKPSAILVKGNKYYLIRKKETYEDLIKNEILFDLSEK